LGRVNRNPKRHTGQRCGMSSMWCKSLGKERELSLIANQSDILKIKGELRKALKLGI